MGKAKFDFNGKVALITGGSSGIGRETAIKFARNGAKVVVSDVNKDLGMQTVQMIKNSGGEAAFFSCDVSDPSAVAALVKSTIEKYGHLNVACNDAGVEGSVGTTTDCTLENWDKIIDVNLKGTWLCMKYQIPELLREGGGAIVNIASIAGLIGFPGLPAYVASKHGINGLTKTAALEFAEKNIRINSVCPGPIITPMLERLMDGTPGFKANILAGVPEKRIGKPEDVADTVMFLCSEQATYITGQCLAVDGGWVAQ